MRVVSGIRLAALVLMAAQAGACAGAGNQVELNGQKFQVELAVTREAQAMGLMFRESLQDDHGMLFVFPAEAPRSFWMRNTRIPLDILYFDGEWTVVSIVHGAPPCAVQACPAYPSEGPARYVLEINAGKAKEIGARKGDRLKVLFDL